MNFHVMIVEDDLGIRETLSDLLDSCGYKVSEAINGKDAWDQLSSGSSLPDLVITDIMMPIMDGARLLELIKTDISLYQIPVIMLTAKVEHEVRSKSLEIGASAYITKPFEADDLLFHIDCQINLSNLLKWSQFDEINSSLALKHYIFISDLNRAIGENIHDTSLSCIANSLGISTSGLQKKIKQYTNHTFSDYLKRYKLSKAKALLQSGKCNVSQSSYLSGFKNLAHFSDSFKTQFGLSPSKIVVHT